MIILVQPNKGTDSLHTTLMVSPQTQKPCNTDNTDYQEHIVDSSVLGSATVVWDADTRQWIPEPRRQVKLLIKAKDFEYSELWQQASDTNPTVYDLPYTFHVHQHHEHSEGNCHEHHVQMNETPCTSWTDCKANDQKRVEQAREDSKNLYRNIRRRVGYKPQASSHERSKQDLEKFKEETSE
jgi:hypothetical protein